MIKITKSEREALEKVGLLRHKKVGYNACDPSFYVANKEHTGRNKHTYIVEDSDVMKFLGYYEGQNLQRINEKQYKNLLDNNYINEDNIQRWGQYNPKAICYENQFGEYRVAKIASIMMFLGLWKDNKRKRMAKSQEKMEVVISSERNDNLPDINEQAKEIGMPEVIFRNADTGDIIKYGDKSLLSAYGISI